MDEQVSGWRVGRVAGIPVYVGRSLPLLVLVIILVNFQRSSGVPPSVQVMYAAAYAVILILSVLAHEAAHAISARRFGFRVDRVVADILGGHTVYDVTAAGPGARTVIAVAGPLANLVIAGISQLAVQGLSGVPRDLVGITGWANLVLAVFNLLPGLPLDGGHVVEAAVWRLTGDPNRGLIAAGWAGRGLVVVFIGWFVARPMIAGVPPDFFVIAWIAVFAGVLWMGASHAVHAGQVRSQLAQVPVAAALLPAVTVPYTGTVASCAAALAAAPVESFVVVTDPGGRPLGLVEPEAFHRVPIEQQPQTPLSSVMAAMPSSWIIVVDPHSHVTPVIAAMQESNLPVSVVVDQTGRLLGVATVEHLNATLG